MDGTRRPSRLTRMIALGATVIAAGACYRHTFDVGAGAPGSAVAREEWRHHWLWGLVSPDRERDVREVCPSGDATIQGEVTFLNGLVSALTGGIYSPTTVRFRCASTGASVDVELSEDDLARIVAAPEFLGWVEEVLPERLGEAAAAPILAD